MFEPFTSNMAPRVCGQRPQPEQRRGIWWRYSKYPAPRPVLTGVVVRPSKGGGPLRVKVRVSFSVFGRAKLSIRIPFRTPELPSMVILDARKKGPLGLTSTFLLLRHLGECLAMRNGSMKSFVRNIISSMASRVQKLASDQPKNYRATNPGTGGRSSSELRGSSFLRSIMSSMAAPVHEMA